MKYTSRPYAAESDQNLIIDLVRARPAVRITDFPSVIDLQEMLELEEIRANTRLWFDASNHLAGYAILDETQLTQETVPGAAAELFPLMLAWAEEQNSRDALEISCRDTDTVQIERFEAYGFVRQDEGVVHMRRALITPIPDPVLPAGFVIRPIAGEQEVEAHVALHRDAWGTENMTVEYRLSMMRTPTYDRTLDLLAVAPDGRFAAYCMCYIVPEANALSGCQDGYTDPIATHPDFQRRGLAAALMLAGMKLLRERGMETARMGTSLDNIPMQHAAARVGFQVEYRTVQFAKPR